MINENVLNEMEQRGSEKMSKFMSRQQMARNVIRKMNALEVHLMHLMAEQEIKGKSGGTIKTGDMNEHRPNITKETKESILSIA